MIKIKLLFIESYSSSGVEKQMQINAFLSQFRRSNQKIAKIKKEILIIFNDLQKKDLIDSRFKLVSETGKEDKLTKLSTSNKNSKIFINTLEFLSSQLTSTSPKNRNTSC